MGYTAQSQIYSAGLPVTDVSGNMLRPNKASEDIQGTRYLHDGWSRGQIVTPEGRVLDIPKMKFNLVMNRIEFLGDGNAYELTIPCQYFKIDLPTPDGSYTTSVFKASFPATELQNDKSFYEVIYDGESKLLKHHRIRVSEYAEAGSMTRTKHFDKITSLYIYHPKKNSLIKVSKKRAEVLAAFDDQKEAIEKFLNQKKIKRTTESDLISICQFYDNQNMP